MQAHQESTDHIVMAEQAGATPGAVAVLIEQVLVLRRPSTPSTPAGTPPFSPPFLEQPVTGFDSALAA